MESKNGALLRLATAAAYEKGLEGLTWLVLWDPVESFEEGLGGPSLLAAGMGPLSCLWLPGPLLARRWSPGLGPGGLCEPEGSEGVLGLEPGEATCCGPF